MKNIRKQHIRGQRPADKTLEYKTLFLRTKEFKDRKSIYISKEMQQKIAHIAGMLMGRELSIGAYIENVMAHHFETYKDEIDALYESGFKKPSQL